MSDSSSSPPPPAIAKPNTPLSHRRTPFMIQQENNKILDYIRSGATDRQIQEWVGLTWRNYRKRIATLQKQDMEQTMAERTAEARAFTLQRTLEKIHMLEMRTNQMIQSTTADDRTKIEAMKFLLSIYEDEYSLKELGPLMFLSQGATLPGANQQKALEYRNALRVQEQQQEYNSETSRQSDESISKD